MSTAQISLLDLLPPIFLSGIGTFFIVLIGRAILSALPFSMRGLPERLKLRRRQSMLTQAERAIERDDIAAACSSLRGAFYLDTVRAAPELLDRISNHHHAVLARLVLIAEKSGGLLSNLPVVEDLLIRRGDLLKELDEGRRSRAGLARRRGERGRSSPGWALDEYDRRIETLQEKLATNRQSLERQLDSLFQSLSKAPSTSEVTYH